MFYIIYREMKIFTFFGLIAISIQVFSQSEDKSLYEKGVSEFALRHYSLADSLFSASLKMEPNMDSYFNRAICRKALGNKRGYCIDLNFAAELNDVESLVQYRNDCETRKGKSY